MARDANVRIVLTANDQASGPIRNVQNSLRGVQGAMGSANQMAGVLAGGLAGIAATAGVDALMQLGQAAFDLGRQGEQFGLLRDSFDNMAAGVGASSEQMLSAMRNASNGMIADQDLILAANRAMMLGVADSSEKMGQLLSVAAVRGRAMGLSTAQAFNDLVTGLGRMSPLILDNLGIVTGGEAVFKQYAASIGKTADALTDAERKQALFNKVVASTDTSATPVVSQFERMDAAIQNAKGALGELFSPAVAAIAQQLADSVNGLLNTAAAPQESTALADLKKQLADATAEYEKLAAAQQTVSELPFTKGNAGFAEGPAPWDNPPEVPAPDTSKLDAAKKRVDDLGVAVANLELRLHTYATGMDALDPKLDRLREKQAAAAQHAQFLATAEELVASSAGIMQGALDRAGTAVDSIRGKLIAAAAAGMSASAALSTFNAAKGLEDQANKIREGLGNLGFYEPEDIKFYVDVNTARAQQSIDDLIGGFNEVENTIKSISTITPGLLDNMSFDEALSWQAQQEASLRAQAESLREQGYTDQQIAQYLRANVMETQNWASSLGEVGDATGEIEDQFEGLRGRVLSAVQAATNLDIGLNVDEFMPREDALNENARRLAAIMRDGVANQEWLDEFRREAPEAWFEVLEAMETGGDVRGTAARILQQFQAGFRPELLDLGAIKDKIKSELAGEAAMQDTAAQITAELVMETGGDSDAIQRQVEQALGLTGSQITVDLVPDTKALTDGLRTDFGKQAGDAVTASLGLPAAVSAWETAGARAFRLFQQGFSNAGAGWFPPPPNGAPNGAPAGVGAGGTTVMQITVNGEQRPLYSVLDELRARGGQ